MGGGSKQTVSGGQSKQYLGVLQCTLTTLFAANLPVDRVSDAAGCVSTRVCGVSN